MPQEFVPFDEEIIDAELQGLRKSSSSDAAKLDFCMARYESVGLKEDPRPASIKAFAHGILELRHENGSYKGRLLFYEPSLPKGTEELVMLTVFRKSTEKTPQQIVKRAEKRMKLDQQTRSAKEQRN